MFYFQPQFFHSAPVFAAPLPVVHAEPISLEPKYLPPINVEVPHSDSVSVSSEPAEPIVPAVEVPAVEVPASSAVVVEAKAAPEGKYFHYVFSTIISNTPRKFAKSFFSRIVFTFTF